MKPLLFYVPKGRRIYWKIRTKTMPPAKNVKGCILQVFLYFSFVAFHLHVSFESVPDEKCIKVG